MFFNQKLICLSLACVAAFMMQSQAAPSTKTPPADFDDSLRTTNIPQPEIYSKHAIVGICKRDGSYPERRFANPFEGKGHIYFPEKVARGGLRSSESTYAYWVPIEEENESSKATSSSEMKKTLLVMRIARQENREHKEQAWINVPPVDNVPIITHLKLKPCEGETISILPPKILTKTEVEQMITDKKSFYTPLIKDLHEYSKSFSHTLNI